MKKILYIIALGATLIVSSCQKVLVESPKSFIAPQNFFKTDQDAVSAVNGAYFWLIGNDANQRLYQQELWEYLDEDCDAILFRTGTGALVQNAVSARYGLVMWTAEYRGVQTTSQIIDLVGKTANTDIKKRTVGEAQFLRALFYYYLTCTYKDVPLITEDNYANADVTGKLGNTPADQIRDFMIKDLQAAIAVLPAKYTSATDKGRATKGAAQTLLTKVYLWKKDWQNALTTAQSITGYTLMPNYADVFTEANEFNAESIFEIDFQKDKVASYQHSMYTPRPEVGVVPFTTLGAYGNFMPLSGFISSFEANDKRKASIVALGYNGQAFRPSPPLITAWFGPKWWRLDAGTRNSGLDIYVFRYADVLLMAAEAANELNQQDVALAAINQVRARAGIPALAGLSQDALRNAIRQERRIELVGEGHRKFDLVRWGIWYSTAKAAQMDQAPARANSYQTYFDYMPIPATQIAINPNLKQNPGY